MNLDSVFYLISSWEGPADFLKSIWGQLFISLLIFLFFLLARRIFSRYVFVIIIRFTRKIVTDADSEILNALDKPLQVFFLFLGIYLSLSNLPLPAPYKFLLIKVFRAFIIAVLAWGVYNFFGEKLFDEVSKKLDISIDQILIPFLAKLLRFTIIALALSIIAQEWGYDVSGFIAGLGLGGLAIALAAKDTISNIFGGMVIITEKPFSIGDWIMTPSVDGIVEDISFRSTKVRTFAQSLVTVPNSTLAGEPITNWSKMGKRRVSFDLGVVYTTPKKKLGICIRRIKEMLEHHPGVHQDTIFVRFDSYGDNSLNIFIYFFTIATNWGEHLRVKEDTNFKIMGILEEENVQVAIPSRRIHFETSLPHVCDTESEEKGK